MSRIYLFIDTLGAGGAQRQLVGLASLLHKRGHEVMVGYYHPIHFYKPFLDERCVPNQLIPGAENGIKRILCVRRSIRKFQPDTVISYLDVPNIIACLLCASGMKFRLISSERNTTQVLSRREKLKFFLMHWATSIVPNSFSQEMFVKEHFPSLVPKVTTITNFVDTDAFSPAVELKPLAADGRCRIIVVGRIARQKNVMRFLQAVKMLCDEGCQFSVDWYGYRGNDADEQWFDFVHREHLNEIFSFHNPSQDIIARYRESDIFVLPSVYEGFPNVLCEAMSCGLPVACGNVCDNPMIIENGKNGLLFDPLSVDDIAEKMKRLILMPIAERQIMGIHSRNLALKKFSSEEFADKYEALI